MRKAESRARYILSLSLCALAFLFPLAISPLAAQSNGNGLSVASGELESAAGKDIVFVNYEGPQSRIDSAAEIAAIGSGLGRELKSLAPASGSTAAGSAPAARRAGSLDRYAVIRLVDPAVKEGLDADIVVIGKDAEVDHVKNLRRIIAGYLEAAWGYSRADAATLAVYVTVYNAVHRGDMAYFGSHYKALVLTELAPANAGLSLRYDEWAGKSRIVIPLSRNAKAGALGAVDTGAVSDKATTEKLRGEPGASVGDRQAMTELKSREVDQRQGELAASQAEIAAKQAALDAEKARIAADKAKLEADKVAATAAGTQGAAPGTQGAAAGAQPQAGKAAAGAAGAASAEASAAAGTAATDKAAAAAEGQAGGAAAGAQGAVAGTQPAATAEALAAREAEIKARESAAAGEQAALDTKKEEAAAESAAVEAKKEEVAADRASVAADQKAAIAAEVEAKNKAEAAGVYLLQLIDAANPFARVVFVDLASGRLVRASTLNSIRPQSFVDGGDSFVAVAGKEGGTGAVRLVKLAKSDLAQTAESAVDLFANSGLWSRDGAFYAVAKESSGGYRLLRFDAGLKETARSAGAVNPWTALSFTAEGIVVQGSGGGFLVLSADKLELVRELKL